MRAEVPTTPIPQPLIFRPQHGGQQNLSDTSDTGSTTSTESEAEFFGVTKNTSTRRGSAINSLIEWAKCNGRVEPLKAADVRAWAAHQMWKPSTRLTMVTTLVAHRKRKGRPIIGDTKGLIRELQLLSIKDWQERAPPMTQASFFQLIRTETNREVKHTVDFRGQTDFYSEFDPEALHLSGGAARRHAHMHRHVQRGQNNLGTWSLQHTSQHSAGNMELHQPAQSERKSVCQEHSPLLRKDQTDPQSAEHGNQVVPQGSTSTSRIPRRRTRSTTSAVKTYIGENSLQVPGRRIPREMGFTQNDEFDGLFVADDRPFYTYKVKKRIWESTDSGGALYAPAIPTMDVERLIQFAVNVFGRGDQIAKDLEFVSTFLYDERAHTQVLNKIGESKIIESELHTLLGNKLIEPVSQDLDTTVRAFTVFELRVPRRRRFSTRSTKTTAV